MQSQILTIFFCLLCMSNGIEYTRKTSGFCEDIGKRSILTVSECNIAATRLGFVKKTSLALGGYYYVKGCYQHDASSGGIWYTLVGTAGERPCNQVQQCACASDGKTCTCQNGVQATGTACTTNGANICKSCSSNYYKTSSTCSACLVCGTGKRETSACSSAANRVCTQNVCTCQNGVQATGTACTTNDANICSSCVTGYIKDSDFCFLVNCDAGQYKTGSR